MRSLASLSRGPAGPTRLIVPVAALLTLIGGQAAMATPAAQAGHRAVHGTSVAAATLTWHSLTIAPGWKSASTKQLVTGTPGWAIQGGVVYLRGAVKSSGPPFGRPFATLPAAARPAHNLYIQVYTSADVPGTLYIGSDGHLIALYGNSTTFTSLAAVSFATSAITPHKLKLLNGWASAQPIRFFSSGDPAFAISHGVVYLSGSLHGGASGTTAAILPAAARPTRTLEIPIATGNGGIGGLLGVLPNGHIVVLGQDASIFASLANISYPIAATRWHNFSLLNGWTPLSSSYDASSPAYAVIGGVVYLSGAMYERTGNAGLWTILPTAVRTPDALEIGVLTSLDATGNLAMAGHNGLVDSVPFTNAQAQSWMDAVAYPLGS